MEGLEEMGKRGYEKQLWGSYEEAIAAYTSAIKKYPNDARLYNNRCLCYLELKDYKKAMDDAESMIIMFPTNKKSYYRKAEILAELKKFEEAEKFFKVVLNIDPMCEDAKVQAVEAQVSQICKGLEFSRKEGLQALNYTGNVEDARAALVSGRLQVHLKHLEDVVYVSDNEDYLPETLNSLKEYDPVKDPNNPYHSLSLWVGNIPKSVSESFLTNLFSKYGRVKGVRIMSDSDKPLGFAFVKFHDSDSAGNAMKHLQGVLIEGRKLCIKYPNSAKPPVATRNSRIKCNMTPTKILQYSEESITKALEAVNRGWSYKAVTRVYGIPRTTLMAKHKGQIPLEKKMGPATAFSSEQENHFVEWLFSMEKTGFPETFLHSVKKLATESKLDVKDTFPSKKWFYSFMKRHPNISQRICQNLTCSRRQVTESNILQWFKEIKTCFDDKGLDLVLEDPNRIFNSDKSSFFVNPKGGKVPAQRGSKTVYQGAGNDEKENITAYYWKCCRDR